MWGMPPILKSQFLAEFSNRFPYVFGAKTIDIDVNYNLGHVTFATMYKIKLFNLTLLRLVISTVIGDLFFKIRWWWVLLIGEGSIKEKRLKDMEMMTEANATATSSTDPTKDIEQSTAGTFLALGHKLPLRHPKLRHPKLVRNTFTHVTHLLGLLRTGSTARNPTTTQLLPSVDDIAAIAKLEAHKDAIIIAQEETGCLDDMSLKGEFQMMYRILGRTRRKPFYWGVKFCKLILY
jgi:hypothetical protein